MDLNNVTLIGRITKDIELKKTDSGMSAVNFFVAVNNGKDKDGNERTADFPKIIVYEAQAENIAKYCKKGSKIAVLGKIKTRSWDKQDGTKAYETYVAASRVQFLDSKPSEGTSIPEPEYASSSHGAVDNTKSDPYEDFSEAIEINPDDLPF